MNLKKIKLILLGNLIVNLPVTVIIIIVAIILMNYFEFGWNLSLIISVIIGWFLWRELIKIWVLYCLKEEMSKEDIFKLGKIGLINFSWHKVYKVPSPLPQVEK